jgi:hypothetical protein
MDTKRNLTARSRALAGASILGAVLLASCAVAPTGPRGPLLGRGFDVGTELSYATGRGDATLPAGYSTGGPADTYWTPGSVATGGIEARLSPAPYFDVGGQISLTGGGMDLRLGLPALDGRALAVNVAGGIETGRVGLFDDTRPRRSRWVRLELYPRLPTTRRAWLVFAAGFDAGTFYHEVADHPPHVYGGVYGDIQIVRPESRLESSIGAFFLAGRNPAASVIVTVDPYFVLDAGAPIAPCAGCQSQAAAYRQDWGIMIVSRFAMHVGF